VTLRNVGQGGKALLLSAGALALAGVLVLAAFHAPARAMGAAPIYLPVDDEVLARVARDDGPRPLARDPVAAAALVERWLGLWRESGDPRWLGRAQAALAPWWSDPAAPPELVLLRATIKQALHDFDGALADLDGATGPQAVLTRATVLTVRGRHAEAIAACDQLGPGLITTACRAPSLAATGRAAEAEAALATALGSRGDAGVRAWALGILGELRAARGELRAAEAALLEALALAPGTWLWGAYADLLLDDGRAAEVIPLLAPRADADALLLRLAIAEAAVSHPDAVAHAELLRARFAVARERGDRTHLREQARFALAIERDPHAALALARENWQTQREAADARLLRDAEEAAR
jgi:hypothetical protein